MLTFWVLMALSGGQFASIQGAYHAYQTREACQAEVDRTTADAGNQEARYTCSEVVFHG